MEDENTQDEDEDDEEEDEDEEKINIWRERLRETAKRDKIKLKELVVLNPNRDPFLCGSEKQVKMSKWFRDIIETYFKNIYQLHLRRVHYYISQKVQVKNYDGTRIYLNTPQDWNDLEQSALFARYLGYVDCGIFVDRRNPPTTVYSFYHQHTDIEEAYKALPDRIVDNVRAFIWNVQHVQPYCIEIWAEKSTMNDILIPLAMKYRCIYVYGLGELSLTKVMPELFDRLTEARKPCRMFYISDFDPAGERMPRSISRKIEWYNRNEYNDDFDIKLKHIIMTPELVKKYNLPKAPIKIKAKTQRATDAYKKKFEEIYGEGAVELDALESLHPGVFENIVETEIMKYFDIKKHNEVVAENESVTKFLRQAVREHLKTFKVPKYKSSFKFPTSTLHVDETDDDSWLYDSTLDYGRQLERYRSFRDMASDEDDDEGE